MPDFSECYGGRFLNAAHVTKPFVDVVDRVEVLEVEEGKKPKPVLFLKHLERGIVLNATRYDAMAEIAGSRNTDDWAGYEVEVRKGKTNYAGKPTGCVELAVPPKKKKAATEAALDDKVPF